MLPSDAITIDLIVENLEGRRYIRPPCSVLVRASVDGFDWDAVVDHFVAYDYKELREPWDGLTEDHVNSIHDRFCEWVETQSAHTRLRAAALLAGTVC